MCYILHSSVYNALPEVHSYNVITHTHNNKNRRQVLKMTSVGFVVLFPTDGLIGSSL